MFQPLISTLSDRKGPSIVEIFLDEVVSTVNGGCDCSEGGVTPVPAELYNGRGVHERFIASHHLHSRINRKRPKNPDIIRVFFNYITRKELLLTTIHLRLEAATKIRLKSGLGGRVNAHTVFLLSL